jgi:hypothetical protein
MPADIIRGFFFQLDAAQATLSSMQHCSIPQLLTMVCIGAPLN